MDISPKGLEIITSSESLRLTSYLCPSGIPTIGYGHTGKKIKLGQMITKERAISYLREDCEYAENYIENFLDPVKLTQNQFDAVVSLVFNIGVGNFSSSTLAQLIIRGVPKGSEEIAKAFKGWCKGTNPKSGKKEILPGLVIRRNKEANLYASTT
jgi:lysozyme